MDELGKKLSELNDRIVSLEKFVDTNDQNIREALAGLTLTCKDMEALLYGSKPLRFTGLAEKVEKMEPRITGLEESKKSFTDQLRGFRLAFILFGLTSSAGFGALLNEILK